MLTNRQPARSSVDARRRDPLGIVLKICGALLFGLPGLVLLVGGARLVALGGSLYYLAAGLAMLGTAILLVVASGLAAALYLAFVAATLVWAWAEVGFATWGLLPRIAMPAGLGLWFVLPIVRRRLASRWRAADVFALRWSGWMAACFVLLSFGGLLGSYYGQRFVPVVPGATPAGAPIARPADQWSFYGNTAGGDRFSPATQIRPDNVDKLAVAWTYRTGDTSTMFEGAPLKIGDRLYLCTAKAAISLDPETGRQIWRYDPQVDISKAPNKACRGVSYYPGRGTAAFCDARILWATLDDRMHALDAATGRPCPDFGKAGVLDLTENMGQVTPGYHYSTSPPLIIGDAAVFGALVYDNQTNDEPSGVVRAVDVHSGKLLWGWEGSVAASRKAMAPGEVFQRDTPNAWGVFSADPALGLIYLPMGNSPPDYFGGGRSAGQDRYSSSVVALDAATGDVRWAFQTVHHDLWDMDLPAQPVVADIDVRGTRRHALIVPTKRGEIFVLDRATGKSLYPVVERPVPQGAAPGERLSPTQPYPVGFPSFSPPHLREADMWGATMLDQMLCRITYRERRYDGQFTPISLQGSIGYPDVFGVFSWGSVAVDPERQILFVNASWLPYLTKLYPRAMADAAGVRPYNTGKADPAAGAPSLHGDWLYAQAGTPYASESKPFLSQLGFPCHQPPWGAVAAIDLRRGKLMWQQPFGTTRDSAPLGLSLPMGVFNLGGALVTRSGLAFIGAAIDDYLRAFDIQTGKLLWQARLPAGGQANPVSYVSRSSGRQFVVMAAGGHAAMRTKTGDYLIAYALPAQAR